MDLNRINIDEFAQQAKAMHNRLRDLYEIVSATAIQNTVPQTFMELSYASEIIKIAAEELSQQNEELIQTRNLIEAQRQRYQDLFDGAPNAYLVTDTIGIIQEANRAAAKLFNVSQKYLVGKPIINYVALENRPSFRNYLLQINRGNRVTELKISLQKSNRELFEATTKIGFICNQHGKPIGIRWLIREIVESKQAELLPFDNGENFYQNRSLYKYTRGEGIPLNSLSIWYVHQGVVKLTTTSETGEEMLVGLAKEEMVFGSSMTSLNTYQAIALTNVELVSINLAEIKASPQLSLALLPKITQRLRQTEFFLVNSSRRQVQDRFYHLLQLLKQEIGQPVAEGTRLSVRLTHEELASACCTTRVTITRLISKLQQQGKISYDSKNHIILNDK
ncbi:hypothetical protein NUACC21_51610 [Scytonema sp. NUACC21]